MTYDISQTDKRTIYTMIKNINHIYLIYCIDIVNELKPCIHMYKVYSFTDSSQLQWDLKYQMF